MDKATLKAKILQARANRDDNRLDLYMEFCRLFWAEADRIVGINRDSYVTEEKARKAGKVAARLADAYLQDYDLTYTPTGAPVTATCRHCGKAYRFNSIAYRRRHAEKCHGYRDF